jgi:mannose-1-phosphate guanylyltransferase
MIMAGGSGTRLWPMSRADRPKQLIPLVGGRSLLALAAERTERLVPVDNRWVCAAERYRAVIRREIPWLADDRMLGEPAARDTLNAVAFAATAIAATDPDGVFAVLTSDHLLQPQEEFERALALGFRLVEADPRRLVTFAIVPTFPATGYGYVERGDAVPGMAGAFRARRFVEKPPLERAREFVANPAFAWNSGMFVFHARTVLGALERLAPETATGMRAIAAAWGTPAARGTLERVYPALPRMSVDRALMEPASQDAALAVCVVPMGLEWRDVGSWTSLGETLAADARGNRTNARAVHLESERVTAVSDDPAHVIATIGLKDVVIVRTRDATLVVRADLAERVKDIAGAVPEDTR